MGTEQLPAFLMALQADGGQAVVSSICRAVGHETYDLSGSASFSACWSGGMHATTRLSTAAQSGTVICLRVAGGKT